MKKSRKKMMLMSLLVLILCLTMLIGSTFAWFTDTVSSGKNKIQAGKLDVEVYHTSASVTTEEKIDGKTDLFSSVTLWEPGTLAYENFTVKNLGDLALKYAFKLNVAEKNTLNSHDLTEVIKVAVLDEKFEYSTRDEAVAALTFTTLNDFVKNGSLAALENDEYAIVLYWAPTDNDNLYNVNNGQTTSDGEDYLHIDFSITLVATQDTVESDSFDNTYDSYAEFPILADPINTVETAQADINSENKATHDIELSNGTIPQDTEMFKDTAKTQVLTDQDIQGEVREVVTSTASDNGVTYEVSFYYDNDDSTTNEIHGFSTPLTRTYQLSTGLTEVKVKHGTTYMTSNDDVNALVDGEYNYNSTTGVLTIKSSTYSEFIITYKSDFLCVLNGQGYQTMAQAFANAQTGDTIALLKNANEALTLAYGSVANVTVDLNGYTWTSTGKTINLNYATTNLTIKGKEGSVLSGSTNSIYFKSASSSKVTIDSTFAGKIDSDVYFSGVSGEKLTINGGYIKSSLYWIYNSPYAKIGADYTTDASVLSGYKKIVPLSVETAPLLITTKEGTTTFYGTVSDAISVWEANDESTLVINQDINYMLGNVNNENGYTLNLDLKGHTWDLTGKGDALMLYNGTLNVTDSVGGAKITATYGNNEAFKLYNTASIVIDGIDISGLKAVDFNSGASGSVTMTDVTAKNVSVFSTSGNGTFNNCTITAQMTLGNNGSTVTINGGSYANVTDQGSGNTTLNINGGTFGWIMNKGTITITTCVLDGTTTGATPSNCAAVSGLNYVDNGDGTYTITGTN